MEVLQDIVKKISTTNVLFFDMDGTLVDTNYANFLSYQKAIRSIIKSDFSLIYDSNKRFNRSNLLNAIPNLSEIQYENIIQKKEECYKDFLAEIKLNEVISDILFKYSKTNTTVLVTNCRQDRMLTTLDYFGLTSEFDYIFHRQFTGNSKKINKFQNAILQIGICPKIVIAFENEELEINDAKQAGVGIIYPVQNMRV